MFDFSHRDEKAQFVPGTEPDDIVTLLPMKVLGDGYDVEGYPGLLIDEENRYKKEKFVKLNPPEKASGSPSKKSEEKEARFFSSDPIKDKIMQSYWEPLCQGFKGAVQRGGSHRAINPNPPIAYSYLTPLIQRYYDLEKGHFDWRGSEITRFEREYLDKTFGIVLPRRVGKDENWETFVSKIQAGGKAEKPIDVGPLQTHLKGAKPLSLQSELDDIKEHGPVSGMAQEFNDLIAAENKYKNDKFKKLSQGVKGIFSSDPQKDQIMQAYWPRLIAGFDAAKFARVEFKSSLETLKPFVIVIIQRYYDMQRGHFDMGGSSINKFERQYLQDYYGLELPPSVTKNESWENFVGRITISGLSPLINANTLQTLLLKPENLPLSRQHEAPSMANGPMEEKGKPGATSSRT